MLPTRTRIVKDFDKWKGQLYDEDLEVIEEIEATEFKRLVSGLVVLARRNDLLDET